MSDKVIVSKQDANDLPFVEQEHSGDKYVLLEDIKHWLEDATPVSGEAVAEVRCRNNEVFGYIGSRVLQDMLPLGTKLYNNPQPVIPEGYVLVPIVPTESMLKAGKKYQHENYVSDEYNLLKLYHGIYCAMIAEAIKGE